VSSAESAIARPRALPRVFLAGPDDSGASSTMVFHSPQDSQRPDHLLDRAPQDEQVKLGDFAIRQVMHQPGLRVKSQIDCERD
jgi:hypothetical protein